MLAPRSRLASLPQETDTDPETPPGATQVAIRPPDRRRSRRTARSRLASRLPAIGTARPGERILQAIVAPEQLLADTEEARRAAVASQRKARLERTLALIDAERDPNAPSVEQIMDEMYDELGLPR